MSVTLQDVVRSLNSDEPDYEQVAQLGREALPHLEMLVRSPDTLVASKAAYLAGMIRGPGAVRVLQLAAERTEKPIRVAAANAAGLLPPKQAAGLFERLLTDSDAEVRQITIGLLPPEVSPEAQAVLEMLSLTDPYPLLREVSAQALLRLPRREVTRRATRRRR